MKIGNHNFYDGARGSLVTWWAGVAGKGIENIKKLVKILINSGKLF